MRCRHQALVLLLAAARAGAFVAPRGPRSPQLRLSSSRNPVPPEDKDDRPPSIDPYALPDASTPGGIAALLEVTFVRACMQLSSGYVDTLKLFIAAAFAAYERGFTINALGLELSMSTTQTAGRPLMEDEVELRQVWLCLVFLTLAEVGHPSAAARACGESVPEDVRDNFERFVGDVVAAKRNGFTLETLKLEDLIRRSGEDAEPMGQMERAILGQSMRVVYLTLTVRDEAAEAGDLPPPRKPGPSIPGV